MRLFFYLFQMDRLAQFRKIQKEKEKERQKERDAVKDLAVSTILKQKWVSNAVDEKQIIDEVSEYKESEWELKDITECDSLESAFNFPPQFPWIWKYFHLQMKALMWSLVMDDEEIKKWNIFYYKWWPVDIEKALNKTFASKYKLDRVMKFKIRLSGFLEIYFWKDELEVEMPTFTVEDSTRKINTWYRNMFLNYYLRELAKTAFLPDKYLRIFTGVISAFVIDFDKQKWSIAFSSQYKPRSTKLWEDTSENLTLTPDQILDREIKQWFISKTILDPSRSYWFTHILRRNSGLVLYNWNKQIIEKWKQINVIAAPRRIWKTFLSGHIVERYLFSDMKWYGWIRSLQIMCIVPNFEVVWFQLFQYLEAFLKKYKTVKLDWEKILSFNKSDYTITNNITGAIFKMVSTNKVSDKEWDSGWVWESFSADVIIIEEAARIPDKVWEALLPIVNIELAQVYISSTINLDTKENHFFYKLLQDWLSGRYTNIVGHVFTIDDNERMTKEQKDFAVQTLLEKNEDLVYCHYYSILIQKQSVFDVAGMITETKPTAKETFKVLWYDPGKTYDNAGFVNFDLMTRTIFMAEKRGQKYEHQVDYLDELKQLYPKSWFVMDRAGVWEWVAEIVDMKVRETKRNLIDAYVKSTWSWEWSYSKQTKCWTWSKWWLVSIWQIMFTAKLFKIHESCTDLIEQLKNFKVIEKNGTIKYEWEKKFKDDLVNGMLFWFLYIYKILWLQTAKDIEAYWKNGWYYDGYDEDKDDSFASSEWRWYNNSRHLY